MTTPPGYTGTEIDTEGVSGNTGAAASGTQYIASDTETSTPAGAAYGGGPTGTTQDPNTVISSTPDTTNAGTSSNTTFTPTSTLLSGTIDTRPVGWPQTPGVAQAYRAPNSQVGYIDGAVGARDTTWTDRPLSDGSTRTDLMTEYTGTLESALIGAPTGPVGTAVPAAPSAPTATAGPGTITVSWTPVADPTNGEVRQYLILSSTGGTIYAGRNATSAVFQNVLPDVQYTFKVAARCDAGIGAFSAASNAVGAWNPEENDASKPGGLWAANTVNPVYTPDGVIKAGTGGRPTAPTALTLTTAATGSVVASWTASSGIAPAGGYTVTLSNGATHNVANSVATYTFTGQTSVGAVLSGYVAAVGTTAGGNSNSSTVSMTGDLTAMPTPTLAGSGATNLTVSWGASTPVAAPNGYKVTLSTGQTFTTAAGVLSHQFTGLTTGTATTATVQALGYVNQLTSAASSSVSVP